MVVSGDVFAIRVMVNQVGTVLAAVFSWLTPYEWYVDVAILFVIIVTCYWESKYGHDSDRLKDAA